MAPQVGGMWDPQSPNPRFAFSLLASLSLSSSFSLSTALTDTPLYSVKSSLKKKKKKIRTKKRNFLYISEFINPAVLSLSLSLSRHKILSRERNQSKAKNFTDQSKKGGEKGKNPSFFFYFNGPKVPLGRAAAGRGGGGPVAAGQRLRVLRQEGHHHRRAAEDPNLRLHSLPEEHAGGILLSIYIFFSK